MIKIKILSRLFVVVVMSFFGSVHFASATSCNLSFSPPEVVVGGTSTFEWEIVGDFTGATLSCDLAGSSSVTEYVKAYPKYSIPWTASKAGKERCILLLSGANVSCGSNFLTVTDPSIPTDPIIDCSFASQEIKVGETVNLSWCAKNVDNLTIESSGFGVDGSVFSHASMCTPNYSVTPTTVGNKSYIFKGYNSSGVMVKSCTAPLVVNSATTPVNSNIECAFSPKTITAGETTTLNWDATGVSNLVWTGTGIFLSPNETVAPSLSGSASASISTVGSGTMTFKGYDVSGKVVATCPADLTVNAATLAPTAIVSANVSSPSVKPGEVAYITWTSQNASRMEAECTGIVPVARGGIQTSSAAWQADAVASGQYTKPNGAPDGYPAKFPADSSGTETCTFYPYGSDGKAGTAQSVTITIVDSNKCECSAGSPFSGGSSCASGTTCDGCHCIPSSAGVNGACDNSTNGQALSSAPTTNLCTKGSASAVSGTGPWNWTCSGSNGGAPAYCSATKSNINPSGAECGTATNNSYACNATQTSGMLCASGSTCYFNNGYPPDPCPTNIAFSGNSAHWYCGSANCYANKLSSCSSSGNGDVVSLPASKYKSLWQFQYTYDSSGKKNVLGYKNINVPSNENLAGTTDMQLTALYNFNCIDGYALSNNIRSCDYSSEDVLTTKIYLAPGSRNTVMFTKTQGSSSNAIVMMRFGEPPQGTYSMDSLMKDYPYKDAESMDDVTGKDFIARRSTSGLEHIFDGKLPDDSPGGWLYLRIIPISSTVHYVSYQGYVNYTKYKTWYDNMTTQNKWLPDGDPRDGNLGTKVEGICDNSTNGQALSSAPTTNLCTKGTASAISGTGPWNWTCSGLNGGATAYCSATKLGISGDSSAYKSVTQIEQIYCSEYDSEARCIGTAPRTKGFKNMFPPEKIISQYDKGESYVREDFRACDFNGGNYCNYSHKELSTFKVYIPPNTKRAEISIYNSQGNTPNTIKFVAIARFGEPPQGDYSHIEAYGQMPPGLAESGLGCTIKEATGKDCVVRNSDGITDVLYDGSIEKGGWLYVKFVELENVFYGMQSLITVDSQKYRTWYEEMTAQNKWLPDGDPGEAQLATCTATCTGGNSTCQATKPANSAASSGVCCEGKTCYQCSSGYFWDTKTCSPLSSDCSLSAKLTTSKENDPFVTKIKTELSAAHGSAKCDGQSCDGGIISNITNSGCDFTCTYNNSGEYNPRVHVADDTCARNPSTKFTVASAPDPATGSDCAKKTCQNVSCNSKNGTNNPWIPGTKTEGCATVTVKANPDSLTVPNSTYLTWSSSGASRMEAECLSGPITISRGTFFLSDSQCKESGLIDECTDKGYELKFASNQTGSEVCTFYPTNSSNGLPGIPYSVTIKANATAENSPACTGEVPTNAISCPDDKLNLTADLAWVSVGTSEKNCSDTRKCEYYALANSNSITGYVCQPNNAGCAAKTCHDVYCNDGCNKIKGTNSCLMFPK